MTTIFWMLICLPVSANIYQISTTSESKEYSYHHTTQHDEQEALYNFYYNTSADVVTSYYKSEIFKCLFRYLSSEEENTFKHQAISHIYPATTIFHPDPVNYYIIALEKIII